MVVSSESTYVSHGMVYRMDARQNDVTLSRGQETWLIPDERVHVGVKGSQACTVL